MSEDRESYKNYVITSNRVPDAQFDFDGFGWTFGVLSPDSQAPLFLVVIKCAQGPKTEANIQALYELGQQQVRKRIDKSDFQSKGYYCYWWDEQSGLEEADCNSVSPGGFRTHL
jgi:hypothetical protein